MTNNTDSTLLNASEFIKDRLYFTCVECTVDLKPTPTHHYFTLNNSIYYDSFYEDFGPLNLAKIYRFCTKLKKKLTNTGLKNKKIIHYVYDCTKDAKQNRVNSALLMGAYSIIYLSYTPEQAFETLMKNSSKEFIKFRDASFGEPYTITLLDCLKGIKKALDYGFFNFDDFDHFKYEFYEQVEHGDFNWIVPDKFIAFCGPQEVPLSWGDHKPKRYFDYFKNHNVSTVIRLNKKTYDSKIFKKAGFDHKDLYFEDGGTPSESILQKFISICEDAKGAIAVHCKAGLGRTGLMIACYIMKHYKFTAEEAIAWIRICRPGSIIGPQQSWLQEKQKQMWEAGESYRKDNGIEAPIKHKMGIYSLTTGNDPYPVSYEKLLENLADTGDNGRDPDEAFTGSFFTMNQGDQLNRIKLKRRKRVADIQRCKHKLRNRPRKATFSSFYEGLTNNRNIPKKRVSSGEQGIKRKAKVLRRSLSDRNDQ
ncbi:dual specificity protein phosphatase CDC14A-like isoform X1 [Diabrotica virgifera virgifera]|uniref:protein-tyrosine-phosphatase n=1 Tax=Diabrotica virgifera virgifera TaxID=50390 RepID=A0ABM5L3Z5_DIAVI|nr:dual specificity protein phosphatase CDC14A-like isoform X1 [Diabrotica virgifera virgifera]